MQITINIFETRKEEINFYFSIMIDIENNQLKFKKINNNRLLRIMKSNLILMLYNITEATITNGMIEIFEKLKIDEHAYISLIDEIQDVWSNYEISRIYSNSTSKSSYQKKVKEMIHSVIKQDSVILTKKVLKFEGNLDAKKIKALCKIYKIRHHAKDAPSLQIVKNKRNNLAHGDESFVDCTRDMPLSQIEGIKNEVITFLDSILEGMQQYYDESQYKRPQSK